MSTKIVTLTLPAELVAEIDATVAAGRAQHDHRFVSRSRLVACGMREWLDIVRAGTKLARPVRVRHRAAP